MEKEIINKVANSPLKTIDLEALYVRGDRVLIDLKDNLYQELILKEKDFRTFVKNHDWSKYQDKHVAIHCSVDAIVPTWAFMLITTRIEPYAQTVVYGNLSRLEESLFISSLESINPQEFANQKVVIKGCSKVEVPISVYVEITRRLRPFVNSIMYGEPCSTVPLYKTPKKTII